MSQNTPALADLIGSRICHDLISPIGAISNGVELLGMSGGSGSAELSLISESVANANARIRFFRLAFGAAKRGQGIARNEILSILKDYAGASRVKTDWQIGSDPDRADAKLAFLLIQCLETSMPFGGVIRISEDEGGWRISGRAEKMKINPELWELLSNPAATADLKPAQVQFALAPIAAAGAGRILTLEVSDAVGVLIRF